MDRERVVIKVPVDKTGTQAAGALVASGVRVCLTACYDRKQALVAASCGAEYLAPYLGRMTDAGKDGLEECVKMQRIVDGLGSDTRILVASIRDVQSMTELAQAGLDTFTFSPDVARMLFDEPLTQKAAEDFEQAASRMAAVQ
jgi:transaldolase